MRKPFISLLCPIALLALILPGVTSHGTPSAKGASPSVIMLETDTIRLDFQPARNGGITSIVNKVSGQKFDGPKTTSLLYEIQLEGPVGYGVMQHFLTKFSLVSRLYSCTVKKCRPPTTSVKKCCMTPTTTDPNYYSTGTCFSSAAICSTAPSIREALVATLRTMLASLGLCPKRSSNTCATRWCGSNCQTCK